MQKSKYTFTEYSGNQKIDLENVTSILAYNSSDVLVKINKIVLKPTETKTIVLADSTFSDVSLEISFLPIPVVIVGQPRLANAANYSTIDGIIPAKIAPEVKQTVVLHIKSI